MKKSIAFLLLVIFGGLMLNGCESIDKYDRIRVGDSVYLLNNRDELQYISHTMVKVYLVDGYFHVIGLGKDGIVTKSIDFTSERKSYHADGLYPVTIEDPALFLGKTLDEVENVLGVPVGSVASGPYQPAYVTDDAHLVWFYAYSKEDIEAIPIVEITIQDIITKRVEIITSPGYPE